MRSQPPRLEVITKPQPCARPPEGQADYRRTAREPARHLPGRMVEYAIFVWHIFTVMKKTLHIDERLLRDAKQACGAETDTETVRRGLEALLRHAAYERLRALRGTEPNARDVPRRREGPTKRRAA
jgi:Arc/MetJ family transcription regulator